MYRNGNIDVSIRGFLELKDAENLDESIRMDVLNQIGLIFGDSQEYNESILSFESILDNANLDVVRRGWALHNIANQYYRQGKLSIALIYYKDALKYIIDGDDENSLFLTYLDVGLTYYNLGKFESSEEYLQEALNLDVLVSSNPEEFIVYQYMGMAQSMLNPKKAQPYFQKYNELMEAYLKDKAELEMINRSRELVLVMDN